MCTANICRSASAQQLLLDAVASAPELVGIEVRSAGTAAMAGSPGCSMAPAMAGRAAEHRSQPLTADLVAWADLILPAARDHRPSILELQPTSRTRTFTIRQAGRIADWIVDSGMVAAGRERSARAGGWGRRWRWWRERRVGAAGRRRRGRGWRRRGRGGEGGAWAERFAVGDPRRDVQPLPDALAGRWAWVVSEMDAARGLARASVSAGAAGDVPVRAEPRRRWRLARSRGSEGGQGAASQAGPNGAGTASAGRVAFDPSGLHADDVPDPHVLGAGLHPLAFEQIQASTDALVRLLREVASVR